MKIFKILISLALASAFVLSGCTKEVAPDYRENDYGYVQFKLYKSGTEVGTKAQLDYLADVTKVTVYLNHDGRLLSQTLVLSSSNAEAAEYGLRSEKLKLLAGKYSLTKYVLYDKLDNVVFEHSPADEFDVVPGGLYVQDIFADVVGRGRVKFTLVKELLTKAPVREFAFDEIKKINITVQGENNTETTFEGLEGDFSIHFTEDTTDFGTQTSSIVCDTVLTLRAGEYFVKQYEIFDLNDDLLEINNNVTKMPFTVVDNKTVDAKVPVKLDESAAYIKDYYALKSIWEALNGQDWGYVGENYGKGANWDFNKDIDLWGDQPGVSLHTNGRVAYIDISDFGFYGPLNDEQKKKFERLGDLTEIVELFFGTHNDSNNIFDPILDSDPSVSRMDRHKAYMEMLHPATQFSEPIARAMKEHDIDIPEIRMYDTLAEDEIIEKGTGKSIVRPGLMDMNYGKLCNGLTWLPESIGNLSKLEKFYVANGKLAAMPESMEKLEALTDLEIYNCPEMKEFPMSITRMPSLISLLISNNYQWSAEELYKGLDALATGPSKGELQLLYVNQNNLERIPASFRNLEKLGLLDMSSNKIEVIEAPFGQKVNIVQLNLSNNRISSFPVDETGMFCGIADVESFNVSRNRLTKFPNIFDAKSIYSMASVDFSYNLIDGFEGAEDGTYRGIKVSTLTLTNNPLLTKYPKCLAETNSLVTSINMRGCSLDEIPKGSFEYENSLYLQSLDLSYNNLSKFPQEMHAGNLPYLYGVDVSYNRFASFPWEPLDSFYLTVLAVRCQRNANGERCLSEWPNGIANHTGLRALYLGSNNLGMINDTISYLIYYLDISDNPNIVFDASDICNAFYSGSYMLIYDKTQDIRNCDIMLN